MDCLFCKIVSGEIPSRKIYEDDLVIVFMDINPDAKGHLVIIPKEHYSDIQELPDATLIHMRKVALKMSKLQNERLGSSGTKFIINYGDTQVIKHVHLHVLPHYEGILYSKGANASEAELNEVYKLLTK